MKNAFYWRAAGEPGRGNLPQKQDFFCLTKIALSAEGVAAFHAQLLSCQPEPSRLHTPFLQVTF